MNDTLKSLSINLGIEVVEKILELLTKGIHPQHSHEYVDNITDSLHDSIRSTYDTKIG